MDAKLHVFKVLGEEDVCPSEGSANKLDVHQKHGIANAEFCFVVSRVAHLPRKNSDLLKELKRRDARHLAEITMPRKVLQQLANQPGRRVVPSLGAETDGAVAVASGPPVKLCNQLKFLHKLWNKWVVGMDGNKAAKDFTSVERRKVKTKYSTRKVFWNKVSELVQAGHTSNRACDLFYQVYDHITGVSEVLRRMAVNHRANLWPDCVRVRHL